MDASLRRSRPGSSSEAYRDHERRRAYRDPVSQSMDWVTGSRYAALLDQRGGSALLLEPRRGAGARRRVELDLADPHLLGRHLDALVFTRELEALLERELPRRRHRLEGVSRRRTHVRQLLLLRDV